MSTWTTAVNSESQAWTIRKFSRTQSEMSETETKSLISDGNDTTNGEIKKSEILKNSKFLGS